MLTKKALQLLYLLFFLSEIKDKHLLTNFCQAAIVGEKVELK